MTVSNGPSYTDNSNVFSSSSGSEGGAVKIFIREKSYIWQQPEAGVTLQPIVDDSRLLIIESNKNGNCEQGIEYTTFVHRYNK